MSLHFVKLRSSISKAHSLYRTELICARDVAVQDGRGRGICDRSKNKAGEYGESSTPRLQKNTRGLSSALPASVSGPWRLR
jgi:hypothetical protein